MKTLKLFFISIVACFLVAEFFEVPKLIIVSLIIFLSIIFFFLLISFEKKIRQSLESFRQSSSKVSRASFRLTDNSRKLMTKNSSVHDVFAESLVAIESIAKTAQDNLALVAEHQKQNELSRSVATEGQQTLGTVITEIKQLASYSNKIKDVTSLIDDISLKTNILSLNAAVEAARAGEQGLGFSVVAEAVRDLAGQSIEATKTINSVIESVVERAASGARYADQSGEKLRQILSHIENSAEMSQKVKSDTESQNERINEASHSLRSVRSQAIENTELSTTSMNVATDLSLQAASLEAVISEFSEVFQVDDNSLQITHSLKFARALALKVSKQLDQFLVEKQMSLDDVLDFSYAEIKGESIFGLKNIFDVSQVPSSGFEPKKFRTKYDQAFEAGIQAACDEVFKLGPEYIFALPVDLNAYAPMHNSKFCKSWTGQASKDLVGNRVKRFFYDNLTFLKSARVGLGPAAAKLPQVLNSRAVLQNSGCYLRETRAHRNAYLVQTYLRDTGEIATNLSVPIFVRGQRFGSIVVCWLDPS